MAICEPRSEPTSNSESASTLILGFASRTMRNTYLLLKPPSPWYFCYRTNGLGYYVEFLYVQVYMYLQHLLIMLNVQDISWMGYLTLFELLYFATI